MKKIIQINLCGRAISIQESAYERLQQYLQELRQYFSGEESKDEILNDIEGRISELFDEKLQRGVSHISDAELEEVIASIGRPADFSDVSDAPAEAAPTEKESDRRQKRLYRDSDDKVLGGVCSGIAVYFGIDPTVVRLLFAIITFGGFGTGFLIYLALWILLPKASLHGQAPRRLYRNPDDRMLGGVASGLAAYFHVPVRNVRLIFAAPILINMLLSLLELFNDSFYVSIGFGSLTGTFVLAYIIIWIILPEALTPYQKMEMRGEKVDLDRIRQTVKDGLGNVEERMKAWGAEVKETAEQWSARMKEQNRAMAERHTTSRTVLHGIGSIVRFGIYLFLGAIAFALLVSGAAILFAGVVTLPAQDLFWTSPAQQWGFWLTILLFFIVPVLFLLIALIRRMFRVRRRSKMLRWSFLSLWALGWIFLFWTASSLARDFEYKRHTSTAIALSDSLREVMVFDQSAPPYEYSGSFKWIKADDAGFDITRDTFKVPAVGIQLELSSDSAYHARLVKYAFGRDEAQAMFRIKKIDYSVTVKDSVLDLAPGFAVTRDEKYRGQHVVLVLSVPKGKSVRFTESFLENHERMGINHTSKSRGDGDVHVGWSSNGEWGITQKRLNRYKPGVDYIMEEDGYLSPKN